MSKKIKFLVSQLRFFPPLFQVCFLLAFGFSEDGWMEFNWDPAHVLNMPRTSRDQKFFKHYWFINLQNKHKISKLYYNVWTREQNMTLNFSKDNYYLTWIVECKVYIVGKTILPNGQIFATLEECVQSFCLPYRLYIPVLM